MLIVSFLYLRKCNKHALLYFYDLVNFSHAHKRLFGVILCKLVNEVDVLCIVEKIERNVRFFDALSRNEVGPKKSLQKGKPSMSAEERK